MNKTVNYMSDDSWYQAYGSSDLLSLMHSDAYLRTRQRYKLPLGISGGVPLIEDLTKISHLLISGFPSAGKTSFIQSLMLAVMMDKESDEFAFACYDSRQSEYAIFAENPYCMFLFDRDDPISSLRQLKKKVQEVHQEFPNMEMMIVLDDYGELLKIPKGENALLEVLKLGQYEHAHVFLVTKETTRNVITPEIRSIVSSMVSFRAPKSVSAITGIRDTEFLVIPGEAYILWNGHTCRCNTVYADAEMIFSVNNEIILKKERILPDPLDDLDSYSKAYSIDDIMSEPEDDSQDALYEEAVQYVISSQKASTAILQKHLDISTGKAQELIDLLEERGVIGPERGCLPRAVFSWREDRDYGRHPGNNQVIKHYGLEHVCWMEGDRVRIDDLSPSVSVNSFDVFANPVPINEDLSMPIRQIEKVTFKRAKGKHGYIHIYFMPGSNDVGLSGVIEDMNTEKAFDVIIPFSPEKETEFIEFGKQLMKKAKSPG